MKTQSNAFTHKRASIFTRTRSMLSTLTMMGILVGCASTYAGSSGENPAALSDANIAAIVVGANNIDISAGKIALKRSENSDIKEFAQLMINDHTAVLDSAVALVTKLGVTPVDNDLVAALAEQSQAHEAKLGTLSGHAFDKAYIEHEVAYHQSVIEVIEMQLIPAAQNQELKDTLISVVPAFKAHLKHSQMLNEQI